MKPLLLIICVVLLASCANNQQNAIRTLCKGVNSTGKACSAAVGLPGKCADCIKDNLQYERELTSEPDISSLESKENSLLW
jgi:hypothetical protein